MDYQIVAFIFIIIANIAGWQYGIKMKKQLKELDIQNKLLQENLNNTIKKHAKAETDLDYAEITKHTNATLAIELGLLRSNNRDLGIGLAETKGMLVASRVLNDIYLKELTIYTKDIDNYIFPSITVENE